jgi:calpain-15
MNSSKFPAVWPNSHPHHDKIALGEITESAADSIYNIITTTHYDKFEPKTVTYEIIMKGVEKLNLTIDFEGSQNNALYPADEFKKSSRGMKINAIIRPFRRVYLGYLQIIDPYKSSRTTSKFSPKFEDADPRDVEATLTEFRQNLETEIQLINNHHINLYSLEQDPMSQDSIGALVAANAKFVDFDFMPNDQALYHPISSKRKSFESAEKPWIAQWKRPAQFMSDSSNIRVFQGSISANDIKQGGLGDCWFLSTLAALTEFPNLIKEMFQDDFVQGVSTGPGQKAGVSPVGLYHLRFYKGGLKTILRVDDYFPCEPGPNMPDRYGPLFSKSNGDELWVLLAEKAFAKIHGSYEAIEAGQPHEALMDLTGAPTKFIQIDDFQSGKKVSPNAVFFTVCLLIEPLWGINRINCGIS